VTVRLHLYGRRECHLCAEMLDALERYANAVEVEEIDVDVDPGLVRRFGADVPVLTDDEGNEICRHFLDAAALERHLGVA
jgi:glutaredoxin